MLIDCHHYIFNIKNIIKKKNTDFVWYKTADLLKLYNIIFTNEK